MKTSPGRPGCHFRGARFVDVAKCALPRPPLPPRAMSARWPASERSATISKSLGFVAELGGLGVVDHAPWRTRACRWAHRARCRRRRRRCGWRPTPLTAASGRMLGMEAVVDERVHVRAGDQIHRAAVAAVAAVGPAARDELLPAEAHRPASAVTGSDFDFDFVNEHGKAWSLRLSGSGGSVESAGRQIGRNEKRRRACRRRRLTFGAGPAYCDRMNADVASARAVVLELHLAADLGEQRVVLAETDVEPRPEPAPALAHQDRSAGDDVAVVLLDAEPLRVAVAAVA